MTFRDDILTPPNLVSALRLLLAPVLFALAFLQMPGWFLAVLMFSGFTDVLDGILARSLHLTSPLGAHLDSWGDFTNYITMAICAWVLWPAQTQQVLLPYLLILASFLLPALAGLVKFGRFTGYHTWAVKIAVVWTFLAYLLFYGGYAAWPFVAASALCVIAGVEEILITLVLRHNRTDVRSLFMAWHLRHEAQDGSG